MFLAYNEIKVNKLKFGLIILLVILITYLVYFLTSLAYGLASSYTNAIDKSGVDYVVITEESNENIMMSMITDAIFEELIVDEKSKKAKLGLFQAVIMKETNSDKILKEETFLFGVEDINFYIPSSNFIINDYEAVLDSSLERLGFNIGDEISMSNNDMTLKIIGFTDSATYQAAPIVYTNLNTWKDYRFSGLSSQVYFNAVLVKGSIQPFNNFDIISKMDFGYTLPGYSAQVLTFSIMIILLIIICAFILGIFIYVLTIQKSSMFGVMKAQGVSNRYIGNSVIFQTIIIISIGVIVGLIFTFLSVAFLNNLVPLKVNILYFFATTIAFYIFSIFGGIFSLNSIIKIDPLKAIG